MQNKFKNIPSLDGLRGISILLVLFYHCLIKNFFRGGFIGVDIFFTISGFLITSILLKEWDRSGRIDLKAFYARRARRLLPALLLMITVFISVGALFSSRPSYFCQDAFWAISYVANWAGIYGAWQTSYLGHTWSLAVEEQFYIIWPFVLIIGLKSLSSRVTLFAIVLLASIASALLRYKMQIDGAGVLRIYSGLDTRADPILMGCAAAILFQISSVCITEKHVYLLKHVSLAAAGGLFLIAVFCFYDNNSMIKYGYFFTAILATIVVFSLPLLRNEGLLNSLLLNRFLTYTGKISYGLYLWHVPILEMLKNYYGIGSLSLVTLTILLSFAVSILSFELVEKRFISKKITIQPQIETLPQRA